MQDARRSRALLSDEDWGRLPLATWRHFSKLRMPDGRIGGQRVLPNKALSRGFLCFGMRRCAVRSRRSCEVMSGGGHAPKRRRHRTQRCELGGIADLRMQHHLRAAEFGQLVRGPDVDQPGRRDPPR